VLEVTEEILEPLITRSPSIRESLRRFYKERVAESVLAKSALFGQLPTRARKALAERFGFELRCAGEVVLREGELSDALYAIKSGEVEVYGGEPSAPLILARLGAGEIFGEIAAMEGTRRSASVRAVTDCELLRLEASDLNALLDKHREVRRQVEEKAQGRAEDRMQRLGASANEAPTPE
jgi:CRP-like cAMP-binding protein